MLMSLKDVKDHLDWIQGTSPDETLHSSFNHYLRVSGGNRSHKVLYIGICIGVMSFNTNKLQRLAFGRNLTAVRDTVIAGALSLGLDAKVAAEQAIRLRISWHGYMDVQHDLENLRAMGFRPSKVRAGTGTVLADATLDQLYQGFLHLLNDEGFTHTTDPYYYVAHHLADRELTPWEVKQVFTHIERHVAALSE